jgi:hypothetical protein
MSRPSSVRSAPRLARAALALALALLGAWAMPVRDAIAAAGGPDALGYTWRDVFEPGVVYAWEDISVTGQDVTIADDDANTGPLPLSFAFPYYAQTYTSIAACTNGWVSVVDGGSGEFDNAALPFAGRSRATIAAFWDDFNLTNAGKMYFQDFGDHAVVTWDAVPYYNDGARHATLQVALFPDGRIVSRVQSADGLDSATIGIENVPETVGLTAWFNTPVPAPPYAVEFLPPVPIVPGLDCASAVPIGCGDDFAGDLASGAANQGAYRCTRDDLSGREQIFLLDLQVPTTARFRFEVLSGAPQLLVLPACDPNACAIPANGLLSFSGATGRWWLVVDCLPGQEGRYRLWSECLPLATTLDCSAAALACGTTVTGDLTGAPALQDAYWCSLADYSGREQVWRLDFPFQLPSATLTLTSLTGNADLIVIDPCDANACLEPPADSVTLADPVGSYFVVVDAAPGDEGAYELAVTGGAPPARIVGDALRIVGHAPDAALLDWPGAPVPRVGETYVVERSEDAPQGPFTRQVSTLATSWTDAAATERFPWHLWCYRVALSDPCGNLSD